MNNRRKLLIALGASALTAPIRSFAQQQGKVWCAGYLTPRSRPASVNANALGAFVRGLRELVYVEEENQVIDWRFSRTCDDQRQLLRSHACSRRLFHPRREEP